MRDATAKTRAWHERPSRNHFLIRSILSIAPGAKRVAAWLAVCASGIPT